MNKKWILSVALLIFGAIFNTFSLNGDGEAPYRTDLLSYTQDVLASSDQYEQALDNLDSKQEAYDTAVTEKRAALDIQEAKVAVETAKRNLQEQKAAVIIQAVTNYLNLLAQKRSLDSALNSLKIEEEKNTSELQRFEQGFANETDLLNQKISLLSAQKSTLQAETSYNKAKKDFLRAIGINIGSSVEIEDIPAIYDNPDLRLSGSTQETITQAKLVSSEFYQAVEDLKIAEQKLNAYKNYNVGTADELESAQDTFEKAQKTLTQTETDIEYDAEDLLNQYISALMDKELTENQIILSNLQLEIARINYDKGDILKTDLDNKKLTLRKNEYSLTQIMENLLIYKLRIDAMIGLDLIDRISQLIGE